MTPEQLSDLIQAGETFDVEFKGEEKGPLSDRDLVAAVVCLANRPGDRPGWLLVGVEDDGRVSGARPRHGNDTNPLLVQSLIAGQTRPSLACRTSCVTHKSGKQILVVEVPSSRTPVSTTGGKYLRRALGPKGTPECVPFFFHEMQSLQTQRGLLDYSLAVIPTAGWDDLDPLEFERFRRNIRESRGRGDQTLLELSDLDLAKALGAVEANHTVRAVRVLGLLLFGREEALTRLLPTHEVAFQALSQTRVLVNDFFRWPLLRIMDELLVRFRARSQQGELLVGFIRIPIPDYPEEAFREAVANALVHRDYTRLGAVHVQWHEDRLEITNPGGFPEGVGLNNLLVTPPRPRNPLIADALKRAGLVERTARGIDTIFYEQIRNGRPAPSYDRSTSTDVVLVLPGGKANLDFIRLIAQEGQKDQPLGLDELLILNQLWAERRFSTAQAARLIQKGESQARSTLEGLVERGLIEGRGGGPSGRFYHLSSEAYQRLGQEAEYIRQKGFDSLQQEQMILDYVRKYKKISREKVIDLCRLTPRQASHLLGRMVREGKLEPHGKTKGRVYRRSPTAGN